MIYATEVMIVSVTLLVSAWTMARSTDGEPGTTVSERMRHRAARWWVLPFAWAALAGHWWGPAMPARWPAWSPAVLASMGLVGLALGAWGRWRVRHWWTWVMIGAVGAVAGATLWPLTRGG